MLPAVMEFQMDEVWLRSLGLEQYARNFRDHSIDSSLLASITGNDLRDLVPNHTSDQHPWFQESRSSRRISKRDWYMWRDPGPAGGAPNNWLSEFGGAAWQWGHGTDQYYYHAFLASQPDLNWRNPGARAAI
jgi:alpha-glucosidase